MPSFQIFTNVPSSEIPKNFAEEMTEVIMNLLGKPKKLTHLHLCHGFRLAGCFAASQSEAMAQIQFVLIHVVPDQIMAFAGTQEPAAVCELCCIGKIGEEENKGYSAVLCEKLNRSLKVPADRMYITFSSMTGERVGWNGKTFAK